MFVHRRHGESRFAGACPGRNKPWPAQASQNDDPCSQASRLPSRFVRFRQGDHQMLRLGAVVAPIGLLLLASRMPSPLHEFRKARAFSPQTARRLSTLKLRGTWQVEDYVKSGLVIGVGDGRYYLDAARDRARRRRFWGAGICLVAAIMPVVAWLVL